MRKTLSVIGVGVLMVIQAGMVWALTQTATFQMNATVPTANGISIFASAITGTVYSPAASPLSFGTLTLQSSGTYQWFESNKYFAIFVAPTGGAGQPTVTVNFTEGTSPSTTVKLGHRSNITFVKVPYVGNETAIYTAQLLHNLVAAPVTIQPAQIGAGNYLKIYVGLNPGNAGFSGDVPFNLSDPAGTYNGTMVITATI